MIRLVDARHGRFLVSETDTVIGRSLIEYGEFAESELRMLLPLVEPGSLVLDVGANIGTHAVAFAKRGAHVMAFEPQRFVHQLLTGNVALNELTNVEPIRAAVSSSCGSTQVAICELGSVANFGGVSIGAGNDTVRTMTIDSLRLPRCGLIKVDVEGHEVDVLRGARETIAKFRPALFLECNQNETAVFAELQAMGYSAAWHHSAYYSGENYRRNPVNVFPQYQAEPNLLCLPKAC